jgi:hypothetical protein
MSQRPGEHSKPALTDKMGKVRSSAEATVPRLRRWFRIMELGVFHGDDDDEY